MLHGINKALCCIHLLLQEHHGFFRLFRLVSPVFGMLFHHLGEITAHTQFRNVPVVQSQIDGTVIVCIYNEVGDDLLHVPADGFTQRGTRTRIEFADLFDSLFKSIFFQSEFLLYLVPMLTGKFFVTFGDDRFFYIK